MGVGLLDYMMQPTADMKTGRVWGPLGSFNDADMKKKQPPEAPQKIYVIKANPTLLTDVHTNILTQVNSGKVRFLIDEKTAKAKFQTLKKIARMSPEKRIALMLPYQLTGIMIDEMLNLRVKGNDVKNISLERITRRLGQDKFSALEYGLWRIKEIEDGHYKRLHSKRDMSKFIMIN